MSSKEVLENIKVKLKDVVDSIRDFMLQLGKLRQDLLELSSNIEKLTITPEKEKTIMTELPTPLTPKPPPIPTPKSTDGITQSLKTSESDLTEIQIEDQEVPETSTQPTPSPIPIQKTKEMPAHVTTTEPEPVIKQLNIQAETLEPVSELGTTAIPTSEVISLLNELEQICGGSLPAEEVADRIQATKKALQSLVLYHPVYYEMDQFAAKLRSTSPQQPLSPTDKVELLSNIPQWKRRMM